jgi:hypothetical protein
LGVTTGAKGDTYDFTDEKGSYGMGEMSYLSKKGIIT